MSHSAGDERKQAFFLFFVEHSIIFHESQSNSYNNSTGNYHFREKHAIVVTKCSSGTVYVKPALFVVAGMQKTPHHSSSGFIRESLDYRVQQPKQKLHRAQQNLN